MSDEPTLREGDHEADGWVRYLQSTLAYYGHTVEASGRFDAPTKHAVIAFQKDRHLLADGVVGHQTWAALRGEAAQHAGTDGKAAHTHEEHGARVEWLIKQWPPSYDSSGDSLTLWAVNVGNVEIADDHFRAHVTVRGQHGEPIEQEIGLRGFTDRVAKPGENLYVLISAVMSMTKGGALQVTCRLPAEVGGHAEECEVDIGTAGHAHVVHHVSWLDHSGGAPINEGRGNCAELSCRLVAGGPLIGGEYAADVILTNEHGQSDHQRVMVGEQAQYFHQGDQLSLLVNPRREFGAGHYQIEATLPTELGGEQVHTSATFAH